jgi:NTP pyrophosphatase (non-canonical NTP hydrolase)
MNLSEYQTQAAQTDRLGDGLATPMLGMAGEVGQLAAEFKKRERDAIGYSGFSDQVSEELGDLLWYVAAVARRSGLDLDEIANRNLEKIREQFLQAEPSSNVSHYDQNCLPTEQFPRRLTVHFVQTEEEVDGSAIRRVRMYKGTSQIGDPLDDNVEDEDDYRFHDVFHLAHMAVLGWSPVMRRLLKCKRRSQPSVNRIQDGGRAAAVEEGVSAMVFAVAEDHSYFATAPDVPMDTLKKCHRMTDQFEVADRSLADWRCAILTGYRVFCEIKKAGGGIVVADLDAGTLEFKEADADVSTGEDLV